MSEELYLSSLKVTVASLQSCVPSIEKVTSSSIIIVIINIDITYN